jgi:predicted dehydrogenase
VHTLLFLEPGHFHAALTLRIANARVHERVHLYARPGPEADAFLAVVEAFNSRSHDPTRWRVDVHQGEDPLGALVDDRLGDIVVIAGRNDSKLATIARLHAEGFSVLADKPWLVSSAALGELRQATRGPPLAMDIMTTRFDAHARLAKRVTENTALFGSFSPSDGGEPAIELASVHHLYKVVNGVPLKRPPWYYDVTVQGDGLVDIQSHMVDEVQWLLEGEELWDYESHVALDTARRWSTPVSTGLFQASTGEDTFPGRLAGDTVDGVLELPCNGEIAYRLRGVPVRQRAEWYEREPPGGGDLHRVQIRGSRARLELDRGPETDFQARLRLVPGAGETLPLEAAVAGWQREFPGLVAEPEADAFHLRLPRALVSTHEEHFAMALDVFLDRLEEGSWPRRLSRRIRLRYTLLAKARELALGHSCPSSR